MKKYQLTHKDKPPGHSFSPPNYYLYQPLGKSTPFSGSKSLFNHFGFMFSETLKEGTREIHTALEKKLVSRIREVHTTGHYIQLLELMYGFYQPVQEKLRPYLDEDPSLANYGRQAANILTDIKNLDPQYTPQLKRCEFLPDIYNTASSLGALYVTEGSTLGGRHITKMIAKRLNVPVSHGFSFFDAYGDNTTMMWENFKNMLNQARHPSEQLQMMEAAKATFSTFNNWIEKYEPGND